MRYAELQVTTHFSFLRGTSSAAELFATAKLMGIEVLGVVDRNSLAGIVRALEASRVTGLRLVVGCRLDLADGMSILVYRPIAPPKIAVGGHKAKAIKAAAVQEVHRIDDECYIGGVLAGGIGELLLGDNRVSCKNVDPGFGTGIGEVAIDAPDAGLADLGDLLK